MVSRSMKTLLIIVILICGGSWYALHGGVAAPNVSAIKVPAEPSSSGQSAAGSNVSVLTPSAQVTLQTGTVAAGEKAGEQVVRSRKLDWDRYPGTLHDQVQAAIAKRDGEMAADLAAKLQECDLNSKVLAVESSQGGEPGSTSEIQATRMARLQNYQRQAANCQTVGGDSQEARLRLLDVAVQQKIVGAAVESFQSGVRKAETLQQLVRDAQAGDVRSLSTVAMYDVNVFGIDRDTQYAARYALKVASEDPQVGSRAINYLKMAESYAMPLAGDKLPKFDFSDINDAARAEGVAIAVRLRGRLMRSS